MDTRRLSLHRWYHVAVTYSLGKQGNTTTTTATTPPIYSSVARSSLQSLFPHLTGQVWGAVWGGLIAGVVFYVNGQQDAKKQQAKTRMARNELPLRFGKPARGGSTWGPSHGEGVWDGLLDDIAIWRRVLSPKEIKEAMWRRYCGDEQALVGYWTFDEGSGSISRDGSLQGHDAVLHGQPQWVPSFTKPLNDLIFSHSSSSASSS